MRAIVVYESHWGNTEAVARAIGEGIGPDTAVLTTDAATPAILAGADLVVAGAPTMAFRLPTEAMLKHVADDPKAPSPGDVSHPSMRAWLDELPGEPVRPMRPLRGRLRDGASLVAGRREGRDRHGSQAAGLPAGGEADAVLRRGQLRPASRRRARAREGLGRGVGGAERQLTGVATAGRRRPPSATTATAMTAARTLRMIHASSWSTPAMTGATPLSAAWSRAVIRTLPPVPM